MRGFAAGALMAWAASLHAGQVRGVPVSSPSRVSLANQFPSPPTREQGIGACHAFSSIALLEAGLFRQHRARVRLSEADVFVRRTILRPEAYSDSCPNGRCHLIERNSVEANVRYALENGVASHIGYEAFLERYRKFQEAEARTLEGVIADSRDLNWLQRLLHDPRRIEAENRQLWAQLRSSPESRRSTERYLLGTDPGLEAERAAIKAQLAGFRLLSRRFEDLRERVNAMPPEACRQAGAAQEQAIVEQLAAGRPVAVSMNVAGLRAWGQQDVTYPAGHAFALVGYRMLPGRGPVFETRNSWGGDNPDVQPEEICRIRDVWVVLTPADAAIASGAR